MIAACPTCGARYRIDVAKLPADGARLRCARCEAVFRVRPPADASGARPAAAPAPAPAADHPVPPGSIPDAQAGAQPAAKPAEPASGHSWLAKIPLVNRVVGD